MYEMQLQQTLYPDYRNLMVRKHNLTHKYMQLMYFVVHCIHFLNVKAVISGMLKFHRETEKVRSYSEQF